MNQNSKMQMLMNAPISEVLEDAELTSFVPEFFKQVFDTAVGGCLPLYFEKEFTEEDFLKFLEFCFCDKVLSPLTGN